MGYLNYVCWVRTFLYGVLHDFYRKLDRTMHLVNQSCHYFRSSNKAHNFNFYSLWNRFNWYFSDRLKVVVMLWWTNHAKEARVKVIKDGTKSVLRGRKPGEGITPCCCSGPAGRLAEEVGNLGVGLAPYFDQEGFAWRTRKTEMEVLKLF